MTDHTSEEIAGATAASVLPVADPNINIMADIVTAYLSKNPATADVVPRMMREVFTAISEMQSGVFSAAPAPAPVSAFATAAAAPAPAPEPAPAPKEPAVPIRKSVTPEHLVCLEDGLHFKSLKRHLMSVHRMTPEQYRERWNLKSDYPMVAPNYAKARSELALSLGLGKKSPGKKGRGGRAAPAAAPAPAPAPAAAE